MNKYALILAGGKGTRLWPISTEKKPKQFLNLYGNEIMINETIRRIEKIFDYENIFIIINEQQSDLAYRYIDNRVPRENIIIEPEAKNTAMCIFYATLKIKKIKSDGIITVLSSDHYIEEKDKLQESIITAMEVAMCNENLVTIGITPTYPATGFGYIKYANTKDKDYYSVIEFKEKPKYDKALEYIKSNCYVWNSGMFIWKIESILKSFKDYLPNIYKFKDKLYTSIGTDKEQKIVKEIYKKIENISIDKGSLEKANNVKMIRGNFKWMDIGNINDFFEIHEREVNNNIIIGNLIIAKETSNTNILNKSDELLITIGLENVNIIKDNKVCIVCNKENINDLPQILEKIKLEEKYKKYL